MEILTGVILVFGFLILAMLGLPIPFAFLIPSLIGLLIIGGTNALGIAARYTFSTANSFVILAIPLFILMGELINRSGIGKDVYNTLEKWTNRIPGSLLIANILGCTALSACTGSSIATSTTMAKASVPRLLPRKYDKSLVCGSLGGGSLGHLIPPSAGFIIFGYLTDVSIGKLFIAGIIPGIMLETLFILYIIVRVSLKPSLAPPPDEIITWRDRIVSLWYFWPFPVIIGGVLGSIYMGVATPSEAAAVGAMAVIVISFIRRSLPFHVFKEAVVSTARTTSWLIMVLFAGMVFSNVIIRLGVGKALATFVTGSGFPPLMMLFVMLLIYVFLGTFLEGATILVLTAPTFVPIVGLMGYDLVWFGVMVMITIEIGLISPPVGLVCYVIAETTQPFGITLEDVFKGNIPFSLLMITGMTILLLFPDIALWLPAQMK
ncbi:TRAP transporter large permease [Thermodesulfobacteriota bacterium]